MSNQSTMKFFFTFLLVFTTAAAVPAAESGITVAALEQKSPLPAPAVLEKYDYYDIEGQDEKEIRTEMRQKSCIEQSGKIYDSLTTWRWKWDYGYALQGNLCAAEDFRVTVEILYRFPRWVPSDEAPRALIDKWGCYLNNLELHEKGHRDKAVEAATQFTRTVAGLAPAASCADLDRKVRHLGRTLMKQLNAEEREYDSCTNHGFTQGAVFP